MKLGYLSDNELDQVKADYPGEYTPGHCPTCHDRGWFQYRGARHNCPCPEQKQLMLHYLQAGIGMTYQRLSLVDLDIPGEIKDIALHYIENAQAHLDHGLGLFIHGPLGTGKTMLANLVLKELVKRGISCYATTFSQTVEAFTAGWSDAAEKRRFARLFMNTKVLLLDDLGKEFRRSNRLEATTFDHILRMRVQNNRPTILTTNMDPAELRTGYGAAVLSMLVEKSIEIPLSGVDYRPTAHTRAVDEVKTGELAPIT